MGAHEGAMAAEPGGLGQRGMHGEGWGRGIDR